MKTALCFLCLLSAGLAQTQQEPKVKAHEFHNADLRKVLDALFIETGLSYTSEEAIHGKVSLRLPAMRFEDALQYLLRPCHLTYRVEGSVFQIVRRVSTQEERDSHMRYPMPAETANELLDRRAPELKATKAPASELFWKILSAKGNYFVIGSGLDAPLALPTRFKTNREALRFVTEAVKATLRELNGIWSVAGIPLK